MLAFIIRGGVDMAGSVATTVLLAVALLMAAVVPGVTYFALLLLLLTQVVARALEPLLRRIQGDDTAGHTE